MLLMLMSMWDVESWEPGGGDDSGWWMVFVSWPFP
jgi:hypothetical protein